MVKVDEAFEVRYKTSNQNFEVLVDFDKLSEFKKKPDQISPYDVLADVKIFKDQKKGEIASENLLKEKFPNKSEEEIIKEILLYGECQIPTSYLNSLREQKKKQAINYISENAINPQTKSKYTQSMIEGEVERARFNFHPETDYIRQANELLLVLKKRMPIAIVKSMLIMQIPAMYCAKFYGPFRKYGSVSKEFYDDNGNLHLHMEVNESIIDEVINYIKNNSGGEAEYYVEKIS